jgi:hypothetical protein
MRRGAAVAAALGCVLVSSGCGGAEAVHAGDVTVLVAARSGDSMDAGSSGALTVVGGCAGVGDSVVIWPHGTDIVDDDPLTLDVPGVGHVVLGEKFDMGGGFIYETGDTDQSPPDEIGDGVPIPEDCQGRDIWLAAPG